MFLVWCLKQLGDAKRGISCQNGSSLIMTMTIIYKLNFLIVKMRIILHALHLIQGELVRRIV